MAGIKRVRKTSSVKSGGISGGGGYKKASVSKSSKPKSTPKPKSKSKSKGFFGRLKSKAKGLSKKAGEKKEAPKRPKTFAERKRAMMNRGRGERKQPESFASKKRRLSGIGDKQNKLPQETASARKRKRHLSQAGATGAEAYGGFVKPNPASKTPLGNKFRILSKTADEKNKDIM